MGGGGPPLGTALFTGSGASLLRLMPTDSQSCDVCVVCALPEEAEAVTAVFSRNTGVEFQLGTSNDGRAYYAAAIQNNAGEPLRIHVSCAPKYGPVEMALHLKAVLGEFKPRLAVMTGICAGDKTKVSLGDIIVADRAFPYESGKIVLNEDNQRVHEHDTDTAHADPTTLQQHQMFSTWTENVRKIKRPRSKRQQRDWLLTQLLTAETPTVDRIPEPKRDKFAPQWRTIVAELRAGAEPVLTPEGSLVDRQRIHPFTDKKQPDRYVKAMASGSAVRADNPFAEIRAPVRSAWAVDMEGAAFYRTVADFPGVRSFVVKVVCDYADPDKDDSYHRYACEVSATYALCFIQQYVTAQGMPRLVSQLPPRQRQPGRLGMWLPLFLTAILLVAVAWPFYSKSLAARGILCAAGVLWVAGLGGFLVRPGHPWWRRIGLAALWASPLVGGASFLVSSEPENATVPAPADPTKMRVLVANLDGPDREFGVTEAIIDQLRDALKEFSDVEVRALHQTITAQQGTPHARECGQKDGAAIVLWGWYRKTERKARIEVHFEVLRRPDAFVLREEKRSLILDAAELETFAVQQRLSGEVNCIVLLAAGLARYETADYDAAISRLTKAIEQHAVPDEMVNPELLYLFRGNAHGRKGDFDKAISDFDRVIGKLEPAGDLKQGVISAYLGRGIIRVKKREYDQGLDDFGQVLKVDPASAVAWANRGAAFLGKKDPRRAIVESDQAIKVDPQFVGGYLNRGIAYAELREFDKALMDFRKMIQLNKNPEEAFYGCGNVYYEKGDFDQAIAEYDKAIQFRPKFVRAFFSRGNAYRQKGALKHSIADESEAIRLEPHFGPAYLHRGIAYLALEELELALDDMNAAIALNPSEP